MFLGCKTSKHAGFGCRNFVTKMPGINKNCQVRFKNRYPFLSEYAKI